MTFTTTAIVPIEQAASVAGESISFRDSVQ
jgi:hypothetical protein